MNVHRPVGNMTIQLACAIATTAPDLLNPEGTTVAPALVNVALAHKSCEWVCLW